MIQWSVWWWVATARLNKLLNLGLPVVLDDWVGRLAVVARLGIQLATELPRSEMGYAVGMKLLLL